METRTIIFPSSAVNRKLGARWYLIFSRCSPDLKFLSPTALTYVFLPLYVVKRRWFSGKSPSGKYGSEDFGTSFIPPRRHLTVMALRRMARARSSIRSLSNSRTSCQETAVTERTGTFKSMPGGSNAHTTMELGRLKNGQYSASFGRITLSWISNLLRTLGTSVTGSTFTRSFSSLIIGFALMAIQSRTFARPASTFCGVPMDFSFLMSFPKPSAQLL